MAGSINLGSLNDPNGGECSFALTYDDQLRATALVGINNSAVAQQGKIIGWAADGSEDPSRTFALILDPGQSDQVPVPVAGNKAIQLAVNSKGKVAGFNTYLG